MKLAPVKGVGAAILFVMALLPAVAHSRLSRCQGSHAWLPAAAEIFSAGVFIASGLLVLLPEARDGLSSAIGDLPVVEAVVLGVMLCFAYVYSLSTAHTDAAHSEDCNDCQMVPVAGTIVTDAVDASSVDDLAEPLVRQHHGEGRHQPHYRHGRRDALQPLVALCVHALFEGLALGASVTIEDAVLLFVSISSHQAFAGFALGGKLHRAFPNSKHFIALCLVFACACPLGIGIGTAATMGDTIDIISGSLNAVAAGTFIAIGIQELRHGDHARLSAHAAFVCSTVGATIIAILAFFLLHQEPVGTA